MDTPVKEKQYMDDREIGKKRQRTERSGLTPEEKKKKQKANDGKLLCSTYSILYSTKLHVCHLQHPQWTKANGLAETVHNALGKPRLSLVLVRSRCSRNIFYAF